MHLSRKVRLNATISSFILSECFGIDDKLIIQPWKCWSGLAVRAAVAATNLYDYPVVMSACWYLDYDTDWASFLSTDLIASAVTTAMNHRKRMSKYVDTEILRESEDVGTASNSSHDETYYHDHDYFGGEGI